MSNRNRVRVERFPHNLMFIGLVLALLTVWGERGVFAARGDEWSDGERDLQKSPKLDCIKLGGHPGRYVPLSVGFRIYAPNIDEELETSLYGDKEGNLTKICTDRRCIDPDRYFNILSYVRNVNIDDSRIMYYNSGEVVFRIETPFNSGAGDLSMCISSDPDFQNKIILFYSRNITWVRMIITCGKKIVYYDTRHCIGEGGACVDAEIAPDKK